MGISSVLFDSPSPEINSADPPFFSDLNLDQVFTAVTAGRDGYGLAPFFRAPLPGWASSCAHPTESGG